MKPKLAPIMLAVLSTVASLAAATTASTAVTADNSLIIYEGRTAPGAAGAVRLGFPGVTAHLRFRGTSLAMKVEASADNLYCDVSLDGAAPTQLRLHQGVGEYVVVQGASEAEHTVSVLRCNESWQGTYTILGFTVQAGGAFLEPAPPPTRSLMFIGDSVTCGEMTAYVAGREMGDKINCNARLSYGMTLARRLGAQCHLVSYGGRGIIRDWQGIRDTGNAPQFYELALPDDPAVRWDPARYVPEAIGIQLGTNDFNQGVPDQNEFVNAYVQFVQKIRRDAPGALIFIMDSPIVNDDAPKGPRRTILHFYLEQIVARVRDARVILAPLPRYPGVPGNGHPTGAEHVAMADDLEPLLRRKLGW